MSCWRVLELSEEPRGEIVPQLLIKPQFSSNTYTVFLTDLSHIWSEELDLPAIVRRASEVESPIEVSERDTAQLAILFENVQKSLDHSEDASCIVTRDASDGVTLHTTISLPEPLDSLTWKFHLCKRTAATLKDELILPLLLSSHVQHERIAGLLSTISDKERAITRLVDQFESSNLDLATAFPSIGNSKPGRRLMKREQAARHIPGLQVFDKQVWKRETAEPVDTNVSTLGLFQEALSECTLKIPPKLKSDDEDGSWWRELDTSDSVPKRTAAKVQSKKAPIPTRPIASDSETEEEETEDEFETHENFKTRDLMKKPSVTQEQVPDTAQQDGDLDGTTADENVNMNQDDDDDDEDLDAPPKSQSQGPSGRVASRVKSPTPEPSPSPSPPPPQAASPTPVDSPPRKPKARGFKIGGKSKKAESSPPVEGEISHSTRQDGGIPTRSKADEKEVSNKPVKKGFKIGGRTKTQMSLAVIEEVRASRDTSTVTQSPPVELPVSAAKKVEKKTLSAKEEREETEKEKVERKRRELKRKNEELAKKQAQSKKKKRF